MKNMFENVDGKIKTLARYVFYVVAGLGILYMLVEIIRGFADANNFGDGLFSFLLALIQGAVTVFAAYVSALLTYGFGEIITNTKVNKKSANANNDKKAE